MNIVVVGTRPQLIHLYGLLHKRALPSDIKIIHTGQHFDYEMSKIFESELGLDITTNLDMKRAEDGIFKLGTYLNKNKPKRVYVMGDSTTSWVGALCAKSLDIHLTHIESGLRCKEFIPEEIHRRFIDRISDELWCPTKYAVENLIAEGVGGEIKKTINYRIHALKQVVKKIEPNRKFEIVCEFHRQSNVDDYNKLTNIVDILRNSRKKIIWSVHPRIRQFIDPKGTDTLTISKPLGYLDWISLLAGADTIITDSGGIQLEAYELGKKIIVLRTDTEWKHTLDRSCLVGDNLNKLRELI